MDTSILKDLPRGVRAVLESSAPWADGYWARRNPRVKLINYRDGSTITVDGCPVMTTYDYSEEWFIYSWAMARAARAVRAAECRAAQEEYRMKIDAATIAAKAGALRYAAGQEGGRLTSPDGTSVSARGLFRRVTGMAWTWDSMEFHEFLVASTNAPSQSTFLPRQRRGDAIAEHLWEPAAKQKIQMLRIDW